MHFYASSGGNAGLGCVHAANFLGRPSTVVVPVTTKPAMLARIRAAGASEVLQKGAHLAEAEAYLCEIVIPRAAARGEEPIYVHPYDREDIFAGHSSLVHEVAEQLTELGESAPEAMVCSVGGGGLFCGIMLGIETQNNDWQRTKILLTQTQGAHALSASIVEGKEVTLPRITSQATSLGATRCAKRAFDLAMAGQASGRVNHIVLSDAEAAMGCWRFADDEKMLVELACGVCLALCYGGRLAKALGRSVNPDDKVIIVVCGGSNISTHMMEDYRESFAENEDVIVDKEMPAGSGPISIQAML